jgi:hypothetical protein
LFAIQSLGVATRFVRTAIFSLLAATTFTSCSAWPDKQYTEARLYHYNADGFPGRPFVQDGKTTDTITNKLGALVSPSQIQRIFTALRTERPRSTIVGASMPQHAIAFYDAQHQLVGFLQLDLSCLDYSTTPPSHGFVSQPDYATIADVCGELRVPPFDRYSTKEYRKNFESAVTQIPKPK